jgi:hypothetical protein
MLTVRRVLAIIRTADRTEWALAALVLSYLPMLLVVERIFA